MQNYPPALQKPFLQIQRVPPLDVEKKKFFKSSFYQSHVVAFVLTIPNWYTTWVLQIFFVNIEKKCNYLSVLRSVLHSETLLWRQIIASEFVRRAAAAAWSYYSLLQGSCRLTWLPDTTLTSHPPHRTDSDITTTP